MCSVAYLETCTTIDINNQDFLLTITIRDTLHYRHMMLSGWKIWRERGCRRRRRVEGYQPSVGIRNRGIYWRSIGRIRYKRDIEDLVIQDGMFIWDVVPVISGERKESGICRSSILNRNVGRWNLKVKHYQYLKPVTWGLAYLFLYFRRFFCSRWVGILSRVGTFCLGTFRLSFSWQELCAGTEAGLVRGDQCRCNRHQMYGLARGSSLPSTLPGCHWRSGE